MRVLHLVKGLGPGGAERLLVSLAEVRSADVDFAVGYVLPQKDHLVAELEAAGATVHLIGGRHGLADLRWVLRLRRLVRATGPDVVHVHSPALAPVVRLVVRTLAHRPALMSIEQNVWGSYKASTRLANALTVGLSDDHVAVSEEVRSSMWRRARAGTSVLTNGIPYSRLVLRRDERVAAREAMGVGDEDVVVLSVANFREKKDLPTLLAAAAACADEPRLRFFHIGQGPLEGALHDRHHELRLGDRFRFLGYHPDPPAVMAGADLFALTSRHEGLPIAMLEAMALGVPPVVSAVGGVPEVIRDGVEGVLLEPGDTDAFAGAFRSLAADGGRRQALGKAAGARAADFDIRHTQAELEARYRGLLERR